MTRRKPGGSTHTQLQSEWLCVPILKIEILHEILLDKRFLCFLTLKATALIQLLCFPEEELERASERG